VIVQTLAIVAGLQGRFCEIVKCFSDLTGNIGLLPELERPLIISKRIAGLPFREIDIPDIVQAECLIILVADIALDLQRFFVNSQGLVVLLAGFVKPAKADQRDTESLLVAYFALQRHSALVTLVGFLWLTKAGLNSCNIAQGQRDSWLLAQTPFDCQGLSIVSQCFFGLIELFISGPNRIQDRGFPVGVIELDGEAEPAVQVIQ